MLSLQRSPNRGVWFLYSLAAHAVAFSIWLIWLGQTQELRDAAIEVSLLREETEPEVKPPPPRRPLDFRKRTQPRVQESVEIPKEILALAPPPVDVLLSETAMGGGQGLEATRARSLSAFAVGGSGGGYAGSGTGQGNSTGQAGSFQEYVGGLRQGGLDVVFVIDATGSMGWLIDEVKTRVRHLANWIRSLVPATRFGIVAYRDHDDPEYVTQLRPLTLSIRKVKRFLEELDTAGGGDLPEAVGAGLRRAISDAQWNPNSKHVIIVIGDAPPHAERMQENLSTAAGFRSRGGTVTTMDVSFDANPELVARQLGVDIGQLETIRPRGAMPEFVQLSSAGGGDASTLEGDLQVVRQLAILIFGEEWADEVRPLLGDL